MLHCKHTNISNVIYINLETIPLSKDMFTVIASANIYMSSKHRRWLSLREMISLQGFPVTCDWTYGSACSSFALRHLCAQRGHPVASWPSRRAVCHQIGNSMHVNIAGLVILFSLSQVMIDDDVLRIQRFLKKRSYFPALDAGPNEKKAKL